MSSREGYIDGLHDRVAVLGAEVARLRDAVKQAACEIRFLAHRAPCVGDTCQCGIWTVRDILDKAIGQTTRQGYDAVLAHSCRADVRPAGEE
jgi:hypothetical protein